MKKQAILKLVSYQNQVEICSLTFSTTPPWNLEYQTSLPSKESYFFEDTDLFQCLLSLRKVLEVENKYILCNGARRDAHPSSMTRQMAGGSKVYLLKIGQHARIEDMVQTFGEATIEQVSSISEQEDYYEKWLKSLPR